MTLNLVEKRTKFTAEISAFERRLQELAAEVKSVEAKLNEARGGLAVLVELEAETSLPSKRNTENLLQIPAITLTEGVRKAMVALKKFTRDDLEQWIRSNYPQLQFSKRSVDGPMRDSITKGEIKMLRRNTGNKIPAVYGFEDGASDSNMPPNAQRREHASSTLNPGK